MKVSFCCSDGRSGIWLQLLQQALPQARVSAWAPGAPAADHAVVWAPPQQFFDEQPGLRGIFNVGAGVDALMRLRLPPRAVVVRLDDAGMAVQMAEYACQAVIRHYRQLPQTEAAMRAGGWASRLPPPRSQFPVGVLGLGVLGRRVALALRHFDFPVLGWSRTHQTIDGLRCCSGPDGLDEVLAASRALICLLPLTPQTSDILNRRNLQRLPAGACVINLARGGHLVEDDLLALLDSGH
ncbi:MAG: glyoxylate/hydroxypyruvate reductase A, partial [Rhodoferax sp.]|nr:glyoxylate/hydroxypyruvate reductase A [Rhodoferax sp.]